MSDTRQKVTQQEVQSILKNMRDTATHAAATIRRLQKTGEISKDNSISAYTYNLRKTKEYHEILKSLQELRKKRDMKILDMQSDGLTYREIVKQTGLSYDAIYGTFVRYNKVCRVRVTRGESKTSQKKLVEDWNKNYYPGRVPTLQTKKAFEALNLELKC
jgi:DNA-directed RNA polymerase specialized sigma24 family protein